MFEVILVKSCHSHILHAYRCEHDKHIYTFFQRKWFYLHMVLKFLLRGIQQGNSPEVTLYFIVLFPTINLYDHSSCLAYSFYAGLHASWAEWRFSNIFYFHVHASWAIYLQHQQEAVEPTITQVRKFYCSCMLILQLFSTLSMWFSQTQLFLHFNKKLYFGCSLEYVIVPAL